MADTPITLGYIFTRHKIAPEHLDNYMKQLADSLRATPRPEVRLPGLTGEPWRAMVADRAKPAVVIEGRVINDETV